MRPRLPHPGWLILIALVLGVSATVFHFWWKYRQTQALVAEVHRLSGDISIDNEAPEWLMVWVAEHDKKSCLKFLETDISWLSVSGQDIDDAWLRRVPRLRHIRGLNLEKTRVTDAGFVALRLPNTVEHLNLVESPIADASLRSIASLPKLGLLFLEKTQITDAGLAALGTRSTLPYLTLKDTAITDPGLALLKKVPDLQHLDLSGTRITDAGLEVLKEFPSLDDLILDRTNVTDAGLKHLAPLRVQVISLTDTKVSREGVNRLCRDGNYEIRSLWTGTPSSPLLLLPKSAAAP